MKIRINLKGISLRIKLASVCLLGLGTQSNAQFLGTAESFGVLAGAAITNTGATTITGDLGVWPGTSVTGFPPGIVTSGSLYVGNATAMGAQADLAVAYTTLEGEAFTLDLTGQDLGGLTLLPGVYRFSSSAFLTGTLTLDAKGDPDARFDFQIGSTLITASNASVLTVNNAEGCNTYWQVGSSATLGTGTAFMGHILALESITIASGATLSEGSALARTGTVTLDNNAIQVCTTRVAVAAPEPATLVLLVLGGMAPLLLTKRSA